VHPIIFSIGPLTVYSFGVMLAIAFLTAGNVVQRELSRKNLDPDFALVRALGRGRRPGGSRVLSFVDDWRGFMPTPCVHLHRRRLRLLRRADRRLHHGLVVISAAWLPY
jgi:hypothetical protein